MMDIREKAIDLAAQALFEWGSRNFPVPAKWERISAMRTAQFREQAKAAIEAYEAALWQPIETAPKDGSQFLVLDAGEYFIGRFWKGHVCSWGTDGFGSPGYSRCEFATHWRPLPTAPHVREAAQRRRE